MRMDLVRSVADEGAADPQTDRTRMAAGWSTFMLGDALTVTGLVESSKGRLSIHPRLLTVEESWASLFGGGRWHDHAPPTSMNGPDAAAAATAMVQCAGSHANRLQHYLAAVLDTPTIAIVPPVAGASGKDVKRDERCLLLAAKDPAALCDAVKADPHASRVIQRWYVLGARSSTFGEAAEGLRRQLRERGATAEAPLSVRVHGYPKALEGKLTELLREGGELEPRPRCSLLASAVYAFGYMAYGVGEGGRFQGEVCTAGVVHDGAISRAFYKLREVAARCGLPISDRKHAIDVGASPGGWSCFLAQSGCQQACNVCNVCNPRELLPRPIGLPAGM